MSVTCRTSQNNSDRPGGIRKWIFQVAFLVLRESWKHLSKNNQGQSQMLGTSYIYIYTYTCIYMYIYIHIHSQFSFLNCKARRSLPLPRMVSQSFLTAQGKSSTASTARFEVAGQLMASGQDMSSVFPWSPKSKHVLCDCCSSDSVAQELRVDWNISRRARHVFCLQELVPEPPAPTPAPAAKTPPATPSAPTASPGAASQHKNHSSLVTDWSISYPAYSLDIPGYAWIPRSSCHWPKVEGSKASWRHPVSPRWFSLALCAQNRHSGEMD